MGTVLWFRVTCLDDDVAEVVPSADLAGNVTVGVTSLADPVSMATAGVAFREECGDSVMVPRLSPYLFASLCKWLIISREQPVLADIWGYCWEPGGTHSARCLRAVGSFPQEYAPVMCRAFVPEFTLKSISHLLDVVNRFGLSSAFSGGNVSSLCDPPVLFVRTWGYWVPQVFTSMCLDRFYIREMTQCWPYQASFCQVTPVMGTGCQ